MHIICDNPDYARQLLPGEAVDRLSRESFIHPTLRWLADEFLGAGAHALSTELPTDAWHCLVLAQFSPRSQYDQMIELARSGPELPDRTLSLAGAGDGFHGFKGRPWSAHAGNLHLTVHLTPKCPIERFEVAFTVLATLSIVDALDRIPELRGRVRIKWVNDVLVDEAKVAGVLAYTLTQGPEVSSAVLGIGLNVETAPDVSRTEFVPAISSLREAAPDAPEASRSQVLAGLMEALDTNYRTLLNQGYAPLLARYRDRSSIEGTRVAIYTDPTGGESVLLRQGRVTGLGDGLELHLDDGGEPVAGGRLMLLENQVEETTYGPTGSEGEHVEP